MKETPFPKNILPFDKPVDIGDTNKIYFDPTKPDILIRVPTDHEAKFLVSDPKLIKVAEKYYRELSELGKDLDIVIAPHQFIIAKETSDGTVKPMLLTKRIEGQQLFPVSKDNPKILDASNRIVVFALKYIEWIRHHQPKSVVTDIFRPEQYLITPGQNRDILTLVDIEPRLKEREEGLDFVRIQLFNMGGILYDSRHQATFRKIVKYFLTSFKQNQGDKHLATMISIMVNFPSFYKQFAEKCLAGEEPEMPPEIGKQIHNTPLVINRALLQRFGIEKI